MATKKKMLQAAAGSAGGGGFTAIEDVFSTYLYTGNGSSQTITNGIDLANDGGLLWIKTRSTEEDHFLFDTNSGNLQYLNSNTTDAHPNGSAANPYLGSFNNDGFSFTGGNAGAGGWNFSERTYASWTFRKAPRFFDCVEYTGDGVDNRTIAHNLGADIGTCIIKRTDSTGNWMVWHRSLPDGENLRLQSTDAQGGYNAFYEAAMTDTTFGVRTYTSNTNISGATYVAYLFAHDPLGPSGDGSDGLIACGSYTGVGSGAVDINLGWEPQFVLVKNASRSADWMLQDTMRGMSHTDWNPLVANKSQAELDISADRVVPTATGFTVNNNGGNDFGQSGDTVIYIAIRRGPMRAPESGTEVFNTGSATTPEPRFKSNFPVDLGLFVDTGQASLPILWADRLRGGKLLTSSSTDAETTGSISGQSYTGTLTEFDYQNGFYSSPTSDAGQRHWSFRRAPEFFDAVAYSGNSVAGRTVPHNLGVAPEMMIFKRRSGVSGWSVYTAPTGNSSWLQLESVASVESSVLWAGTTPTSEVFYVTDESAKVNASSETYIAYLFATLAGISKVGSYTGNGSSQTINCGFTSGARFILIKRTDASGAWYVWDTARGIVAANDPRLSLNTTAAEVTTDDSVDPDSSGFIVNQVAATNINVSAASYIFYAIA
jgi:hypothetical protein